MPRDRVISVDGEPIKTWDDLVRSIAAHRGKSMQLVVDRGGSRLSLKATPDSRAGWG